MATLCEICNARPATARVTVSQNGQRKTMSICDYDYRQLLRHKNMLNPFDSLLGGGLSRFFGGTDPLSQGHFGDDALSAPRA